MTTLVNVRVQNDVTGLETDRIIGRFSEVWNRDDWVTIGSDPSCTVRIDDSEISPVAVVAIGASNHKMFFQLPLGQTFPLPDRPRELSLNASRELLQAVNVVRDRCQVGPYHVAFGEVEIQGKIRHLAQTQGDLPPDAPESLRMIAPYADEVIPELLKNLLHEDENIRKASEEILGHFGLKIKESEKQADGVFTRLICFLSHFDCEVRSKVPLLIVGLPNSLKALSKLRGALNDESVRVRIAAGEAVWRITGNPKELVEQMSKEIELIYPKCDRPVYDAGYHLFKDVCNVLTLVGSQASGAVPALVRAMKSSLRNEAEATVFRIGPACVPKLVDLLNCDDAFVRGNVVRLIGKFGREASSAINSLRQALIVESEMSIASQLVETIELLKGYLPTTDEKKEVRRQHAMQEMGALKENVHCIYSGIGFCIVAFAYVFWIPDVLAPWQRVVFPIALVTIGLFCLLSGMRDGGAAIGRLARTSPMKPIGQLEAEAPQRTVNEQGIGGDDGPINGGWNWEVWRAAIIVFGFAAVTLALGVAAAIWKAYETVNR